MTNPIGWNLLNGNAGTGMAVLARHAGCLAVHLDCLVPPLNRLLRRKEKKSQKV